MKIQAANPNWLAGVRDHVAQAYPLGSITCDQLTEGFIACNLVMDLTDFFYEVMNWQSQQSGTPPAIFVKGISYQVVYDALSAKLGPGPNHQSSSASSPHKSAAHFEDLFSGKSGASIPASICTGNPWREINLLLAWEVVLRIVTGITPGGAFPTAKAVFDAIPASAGLGPVVCKERNLRVASAFERWWNTCSNQLESVLKSIIWKPEVVPTHIHFGQLLADSLGSPQLNTLSGLVRHKNNQLTMCVGQLNQSVVHPSVPAGWIGQVASRLLAALGAGSGLQFDPPDCDYLREICDWMISMGLGAMVANIRKLLTPPGVSVYVPAGLVGVVTREWMNVEKAVRTRGLPPDWRNSVQVQDLFFDPLHGFFGTWAIRAKGYGL